MRGLFIVIKEELGFLENNKELVLRNNKIKMERPHKHPEGLLTHFKGFKWLQTWA